jgi:hypothetical protein
MNNGINSSATAGVQSNWSATAANALRSFAKGVCQIFTAPFRGIAYAVRELSKCVANRSEPMPTSREIHQGILIQSAADSFNRTLEEPLDGNSAPPQEGHNVQSPASGGDLAERRAILGSEGGISRAEAHTVLPDEAPVAEASVDEFAKLKKLMVPLPADTFVLPANAVLNNPPVFYAAPEERIFHMEVPLITESSSDSPRAVVTSDNADRMKEIGVSCLKQEGGSFKTFYTQWLDDVRNSDFPSADKRDHYVAMTSSLNSAGRRDTTDLAILIGRIMENINFPLEGKYR